MENNISLYGASGHCKVVIDAIESQGGSVSVIFDDNPKCDSIFNIPVIKYIDDSCKPGVALTLSIGNNAVRKKLSGVLPASYQTIIHKTAVISPRAVILEGSAILAGAIINPDAVIGRHCIINTGAVVEHDCKIGDFAHISPNASLAGNVTIGEGSHIGIGASVIQGVTIGKWCIVGAGAVIISDIPDFAVVVGTPGKVIKYIEQP